LSPEQSATAQPASATRPEHRAWGGCLTRWLSSRWLFALSGLIPLLALLNPEPDPVLLIYSAFVALRLLRPPPEPATAAAPPRALHFALLMVAAGFCLELLSWLGNFLACRPAPALLHPQLVPDLSLALGFYGSWAAAWLILLRHFRFGLGQIFVTQGLYGVMLEQQGAVFLHGLVTLPLGLLLWLYVFAAYGATAGIAVLLTGQVPGRGERSSWYRYPLALLLTVALSLLITGLWSGLLGATQLLPPPMPICERPLW
jgi:hypothetical protein